MASQPPEQLDADGMTPLDSPLTMTDVLASPLYTALFTPTIAPGDPAFDFALPRLGAEGTVRLSDHAGHQRVALIFGSYT